MYTIVKVFSITRQVYFVGKKEFAITTLDQDDEIFLVYVTFLIISDKIHFSYKTKIAPLKVDKAPKIGLPKYSNSADAFFSKLVTELLEHVKINNHVINSVTIYQLFCRSIYSLEPIEFKILKNYIETNKTNGFIGLLKSPSYTQILLVWNFDSSFCLYVNYWYLNNLVIKNRYSLFLIRNSLDYWVWVKQFH